jgi:hypothetical protein
MGQLPKMTIGKMYLELSFEPLLVCDARTGAAGGDRTHDPRLRRPILYPLSYSRNAEKDQYSHSRMQRG